eukprot:m.362714 g.362714  ORF g.362714 m.362714 type:complete len:530 (+) comp56019_c0_seq5:12-1601(+)
MATFAIPEVVDNATGWGPVGEGSLFGGLPYQPFSKTDRLAFVADFTASALHRQNRFQSQFSTGDTFVFEEADTEDFQVVETPRTLFRPPQQFFARPRRFQNRAQRRDLNKAREERRLAGLNAPVVQKTAKSKRWNYNRYPMKRWGDSSAAFIRESSVEIDVAWEICDELDFSRLSKQTATVSKPEDLIKCGSLEQYDKTLDRITAKAEKPLPAVDGPSESITTTMDPHIRTLAKSDAGQVFATDAILAQLMTCTRSVYSWDLIAIRVGSKLFFDKREASTFDMPTVDENVQEQSEKEDELNKPLPLAAEAAVVNAAFVRRALKQGGGLTFDQPSPNLASHAAYIYRRWTLADNFKIVSRCELDAVEEKEGRKELVTIKALHEYNPFVGTADWRSKLDGQRGTVVATQYKSNNAKVARWTVQSLLAGADSIKIGLVSRVSAQDNQKHSILGTTVQKPAQLAQQISLDINVCWGVLRQIVDALMKREEGEYVLLKDPMKPVLRVYRIPVGTFDNEPEEAQDQDIDDDTQDQ